MDRELQQTVIHLALDHGFDVFQEFTSGEAMQRLIPHFHDFEPNHPLDSAHRAALLQNLCAVLVKAAISREHPGSLLKQSNLKRWEFLRQAMPEAADAFVAVLGYLGHPVPECLR